MLEIGLQYMLSLQRAFYETVFLGQPLQATELDLQPKQCFDFLDNEEVSTRFFLIPASNDDTHPCAGSDWIALFFLFVEIHFISWGSRWLIWEPFARWHMGVPANCRDAATRKKIENLSQSANAASFHTISSIFVWRILVQRKDWLWSTDQWADAKSFSYIEADFKYYYLMYAARYVSDMISLRFEHARSDTFAYAIHHVATVALVLCSAHAGVTRLGGVIMFFFDWADPFLLVAKVLVYLSRKPTDMYQWWADRFFELFAVTFFLTRNVMFSYIVYICFSYDESQYPEGKKGTVLILRSMLIVLVLLMTFWIGVIIKAAINQSSNKGNVEDIREDEVMEKKKKIQ